MFHSHAPSIPLTNRNMAASEQIPTRGSCVSLCELCYRSLVLDDSSLCATWRTSSDGTISMLSFPNEEGWEYWEGGNDFTRIVTNPNLPELSVPAEEGCRFCAALKRALLREYGYRHWWISPTLEIPITIQYRWSKARGGEVGESEMKLSLDSLCVTASHPKEPYSTGFNFPIFANKGKCRDWLRIKDDPLEMRSPMSESNISLVRRWLEECTTDQGCSEIRNDDNFVPKRLVDLGVVGEANYPVLIDTTETPLKPIVGEDNLKYACLSYCWGSGSRPLRTTSETLAEHKQCIPVDRLPQVFIDAILVARELGLRYLWIDALCIIQDSASDWEKESGRMSDIFHHSFITFGAALSSACNETFLPRRKDHSIHLDFRSSLNPDISGSYSIFLLPEYADNPLEEDLRGSIWNTRGWVWQEQNMAQRILIFGSEMIHLRCHRRILSENGYCERKDYDASSFQTLNMRRWTSWMMGYSGRKFTHACDKLAAASGLAKSLQKLMEKDRQAPAYLAGLWLDEDFHCHLKWVPVRNNLSFTELMDSLEINENYCAPSWSWASRDQEITIHLHYMQRDADEDFELVRHNLIPAKSDAMVKVSPGSSITVRGKILKMRRRPSDGTLILRSSTGARLRKRWKILEPGGWIQYYLDWDPCQGYDGDPESFLHLFVTSGVEPRHCFTSSAGLVLYPTGAESDLDFFRVGTFELEGVPVSSWPICEVTIF